ncbi:WD-repeat protein [Pochonia chlamydosporia 170]|uniref:WD-repeat protein n=1 Tax=Pochonia chlamydosporia 170 TaxID=1380566 RepID=A0A179FX74_METCM|nr:WD-repeat protein [Pochonia chlamydosporia 170]OAQ69818.1 WD-repeat protein [Pochonia chlamydosporia 170]
MDDSLMQWHLAQAWDQILESQQQIQERWHRRVMLEEGNERTRQLALAASKLQESKEREDSVTKLPLDQLLDDFNAINSHDILLDSTTLGDETSELLYEWFRSNQQYQDFIRGDSRVLCVSGSPGSGKRTLLLSVARGLSARPVNYLLDSVCASGNHMPQGATSVLKSLIFRLLVTQPHLRKHLTEKRISTNRKQFSDPNDFYGLSLLLYDMIRDESLRRTTFIVNGIDECGDDGLDKFATLISTTLKLSSDVRWLVSATSNESAIKPALEYASQFNLDAEDNHAALRKIFDEAYIPWKVSQLTGIKRYKQSFKDDLIRGLRERCPTNFLWADIACEAIRRGHLSHGQETINALPQYELFNIEPMYTHIINQLEKLKPSQQEHDLRVLPALAVVYEPQHAEDLEQIVDPSPNFDIAGFVKERWFAFLELCDKTIYFRHASAREYIRRVMASELHGAHARIVENCLKLLSKVLEASASGSDLPQKVLGFADYAAVYWIRHFSDMNDFGMVEDIVTEFLGSSVMLKWVDLLSSRGKLPQAWGLMKDLRMKIFNNQTGHGKSLLPLIYDIERFLQFHRFLISEETDRASKSLLFSPIQSEAGRKLISDEFPQLAVFPGTSWKSPVVLVLQGHARAVGGCAYSHDGKLLVSASFDGSVRIWDMVTGRVQHSFRGFKGAVRHVDLSASGLLAASDGYGIKVWDLANGTPHQPPSDGSLFNDDGLIHSLALSNDGTLLAATMGSFINVWKLPCYTLIARQVSCDKGCYADPPDTCDGSILPHSPVRDMKFSSDGKWLGTVSRIGLTVWELVNEGQRRTMAAMDPSTQVTQSEGHVHEQETTETTAAATGDVEHGAEHVSASEAELETTIEADLETTKSTHTLQQLYCFDMDPDDDGWTNVLAFSPDSRYVALGMDGKKPTVRIWDLTSSAETLRMPAILMGHRGPVDAICFSADGSRLASGSKDGAAMIWKAPWNRDSKEPEMVLQAHGRNIKGLSFRPDQKHLAVCLDDGTIRIWDHGSQFAQTLSELETTNEADNRLEQGISPHTSAVIFVTSSKDGQYVASASLDGSICLWEAKSGTLLRTLPGHDEPVTSLVFSHDAEQLISASKDKTARIWEISGTSEPRTLYGHDKGVRSIAISDDGKLIASGSDDETVRVWDISRPELEVDQGASDNTDPANNGNNHKNALADVDGVRVLRGSHHSIACVAFSRDAKLVAAGSDLGKVLLWELSMDEPSASHTHREMFTGPGHGAITAVSFGPGLNSLIACSDEEMWEWDPNHVHGKGEPCERLEKLDTGYNDEDDLCGYSKHAATSAPFRTLQVSDTQPDYVMTALGPVRLSKLDSCSAGPESTSWCPYSATLVSSEDGPKECWITRKEESLICLPGPYRPSNEGEHLTKNMISRLLRHSSPVLVLGHTVVIGCGTGDVLFFRFKEDYQSATKWPMKWAKSLGHLFADW